MPQAQPELKKVSTSLKFARLRALTIFKYLDKRLFVQLNGSRKVIGVLRGYDVRNFRFSTLLLLSLISILGVPEHRTR